MKQDAELGQWDQVQYQSGGESRLGSYFKFSSLVLAYIAFGGSASFSDRIAKSH